MEHGDDRYLDTLTLDERAEVASVVRGCESPWLLTYNTDARITEQPYYGLRAAEFDIAHTAQRQHVCSEYVVFGPHLNVPGLAVLGAAHARRMASSPA